jgi:hypothetical protein
MPSKKAVRNRREAEGYFLAPASQEEIRGTKQHGLLDSKLVKSSVLLYSSHLV